MAETTENLSTDPVWLALEAMERAYGNGVLHQQTVTAKAAYLRSASRDSEVREAIVRLPRFGVIDGVITPHPKGTMVQLDAVLAILEGPQADRSEAAPTCYCHGGGANGHAIGNEGCYRSSDAAPTNPDTRCTCVGHEHAAARRDMVGTCSALTASGEWCECSFPASEAAPTRNIGGSKCHACPEESCLTCNDDIPQQDHAAYLGVIRIASEAPVPRGPHSAGNDHNLHGVQCDACLTTASRYLNIPRPSNK